MSATVEIVPKEGPFVSPYNRYEDYVQAFWRFVLSVPQGENPLKDSSVTLNRYGQHNLLNGVFFLPPNIGGNTEKSGTLQKGIRLLIPILGVVETLAENNNSNLRQLHEMTKKDQDSVTDIKLVINGKQYNEIRDFRFHTPSFPSLEEQPQGFSVTLPTNSIYNSKPGETMAVADGYYVLTTPLAPGNYNIEFSGDLLCTGDNCVEPTFHTTNIYHLNLV